MAHETEQVLLGLYERDGKLTPEKVVAEAEPEGSPLHDRFEWDNDQCGVLYRLEQARELIRRVETVIYERPIRKWTYVPSESAYQDVEEVMSREDWRQQVLADFEKDAARFKQRWATHRDVAEAYTRWVTQQTA